MRKSLQRWLNDIPIRDPIKRQQAFLVQVILIGMLIVAILGLLLDIFTPGTIEGQRIAAVAILLVGFSGLIALVTIRRGRFEPAVVIATVGFVLSITITLVPAGVRQSGVLLIAFTIPIAVAGLLLGRRGLLLIVGLSTLAVIGTALLENRVPPLAGFAPLKNDPMGIIGNFLLIAILLSLLLDRFGNSLQRTLTAALAREQELQRLRMSLESTVAERTASLQEALRTVEQREEHLAQTVEDLRASQATIQELSAPVIPVLPGVLVAPLIGVLDTLRADALAENVLGMVERLRARHVIFDITGVPIVDTHVATVLLQTAAAVRLLGAQVLLVGVRPEVAQTIVTLGIDLSMIATYPNLQEAVIALLGNTATDMAPAGRGLVDVC